MKLISMTTQNIVTPFRSFGHKALLLMVLLAGSNLLSAGGLDTWEQQAKNQFNPLISSIAYGNGTFVAVGANGLIVTSPDGATWTGRTSGQTGIYRCVIFAENRFLAVGSDVPVLESSNGTTWTPSNAPLYNFYGVAYGNHTYVAVGFLGKIFSSTDGKVWTQRTSGTSSRLHSVTYGNNQFVACGLSGTILTSTNGVTWSQQTSNSTDGLFGIAFGNGIFVAVSSKAKVLYSSNATNWTTVDLGGGAELWGAKWDAGIFMIVGYAGNNPQGPHLWSSSNGADWTRLQSNVSRTLNAVAYGANRWVAVGENGTVTRSGIYTGPTPPATPTNVTAISAGPGKNKVTWVDKSSGETGFRIERKKGLNGTWTTVGTVAANVTFFEDTNNVESNTVYYYRVAAENGSSISDYSVESTEVISATVSSRFTNLSNRALVGTGDDILIASFKVKNAPLRIYSRVGGPSLISSGFVDNHLADPVLELYKVGNPVPIAENDNWKSSQQALIESTAIPPSNDVEPALVATLVENGFYSLVVKGVGNTVGFATVEIYEFKENGQIASMTNLSSRALVGTGDNILIGSFFVKGNGPQRIYARVGGPSLIPYGFENNHLADPILELYQVGNPTPIAVNDNWKSTQQALIATTQIPPANDVEPALVATLQPGSFYSVVVKGAGSTEGFASVELYDFPE
ncbi:MAG: fibronectin type III domain-containing protein [Verrucomicrobiae bacterium]|nr:fibronectin type III domain-containing protein [Verrucomicrobiae bacterium]